MLSPGHCPDVEPLVTGPLSGQGAGNVVACHNDLESTADWFDASVADSPIWRPATDGSCTVVVQRSDGTILDDGGTYAPGEELTVAIISECQLSADHSCGDGREVLLELEGSTFAGGEGTTGCDDLRMINPFRPPTVIAPASGPLVFRGATAYCRGRASTDAATFGEVISHCCAYTARAPRIHSRPAAPVYVDAVLYR